MLRLQCARYREETLGDPGANSFVDHFRLQSHRHGIGLVGAGVVKLAVDKNRDGNQAGLAIRSELQQSDGSGALDRFLLAILGGAKLHDKQKQSQEGDDAPRRTI